MPTTEETTASLQQGDSSIPRLRMGEMGYNALRAVSGQVFEEEQRELRYPDNITTYKRMLKDATVAPCVRVKVNAAAAPKWVVKVPKGYEDELRDKVKFVESLMTDMDHPWEQFIRQAASHDYMGFAVNEIVLRKRLKTKGSKYNDGLVGIKRLPTRQQSSITGWKWSEKGNDLVGLWQRRIVPTGKYDTYTTQDGQDQYLERYKFLLFRNDATDESPYGTSSLNSCYRAYKAKTELELHEALGVVQDCRGLKVLYIHPKFMDVDASSADKAAFESMKRMMVGMGSGEQTSAILPQIYDDNGKKMFELDILSAQGSKAYDSNAIIERYKKEIVTALFASQMILGQGTTGSYSLAESLNGVTQLAVESILNEIKAQLNQHLLPLIFKWNRWDTEVMPYFDYESVSSEDLDVFSKYVQRIGAGGYLAKTPEVINTIHERGGLPIPFDDTTTQEEMDMILTPQTTRSGDGMAAGGLNGTSTGASLQDNSVGNMENT